ncbi:MAG TPA: response regulator [Candidatus Nitrosotalea sp.]|nr:response regulator [Candidatus Nitrosotalea sp.]
MDADLEKFDLACTYMKNDQNLSAYNLFMDLAQKELKNENLKAGVYLILASECKSKQGKDGKEEYDMAAKYYLKIAKKNNAESPYAYRCAAKCFLKSGQVDKAMKISEEAKKYMPKTMEERRTIVVVDDSPAITLRLKSYLERLGYDDIRTAGDGKSALALITKLIDDSQNPVILLDMEMPGMTGDSVAKKLLEKKPDLSIILITADEKSEPRVRKTIGFGSTAFIQKPFTINELKNALDVTESNRIR